MATVQPFHPQSVAAQALAPLSTLSAALDTIQSTLQTSTTYSSLSATTNTILAADESLSSALELLHQQQNNHARILALQAEVLALENQIKDTISRARSIRNDITSIHPSIDNDDSDSDIENPEVDYQQLLNFAARIGKHNAVAKLEAEQQGERLKNEANKARKKSEQAALASTTENGIPQTTLSSSQQPHQDPAEIRDKIDREAAELSARSDAFHSFSRLPFPTPDLLRMGALGLLQQARESDPGDPEGAVDREAEKLVRETEDIAPDEGVARRQREKEEKEREDKRRVVERRAEQQKAAAAAAAAAAAGPAQVPQQRKEPQVQQQQQQRPPEEKKKKLNLDFPGDYGDDSDDD